MEFSNLYQIAFILVDCFTNNIKTIVLGGLLSALVVWAIFFVLQGVGLFIMAKNRGLKNKWLAFVPFANIYYIGKMAGECSFFGHKMRSAGLYAMIAHIITTLLAVLYVLAEGYLYYNHGAPIRETEFSAPYWKGLSGFSVTVHNFYGYGLSILSIFSLVSRLLMIVLLMGLYKQYASKNYFTLAFLCFFIPEARFITVFVLRNRQYVDYGAYVRRRREEYARRQQQYYNMNGNPYGRSPYGNNGQGNPYGGYQQPSNDYSQPTEEPFAEFSSEKNKNTYSGGKSEGGDDFFN